ncbi:MAG: response regulator [Pseudomonadales bacterium]
MSPLQEQIESQAASDAAQLSARSLASKVVVLEQELARLKLDNPAAPDLQDGLTALGAALSKLKQCVDYRPLQSSQEGERTWLHDFRNNVNAVRGYAEMCLEDTSDSTQELNAALHAILHYNEELMSSFPATPEQTVTQSIAPAKDDAKTGRLLVVEDNEVNRKLLCRHLLKSGHTLLEASSGAETLRQLEDANTDLDLILLDLMLPDMNGFDILQRIKNTASLREIPVIMISGQQHDAEVIRCIQAGAEDYLFKPVNEILLSARIDASLERKSWRDREQTYLAELSNSHAFIRKTFGRYTSEEIAERLLEHPDGLDMGGSLQVVTTVMTDICGFTALCNRLRPTEVVQLLNNYLGTLSAVIVDHGGTVDEFIGDAILAIFGAPLQSDDDADRAVACAISMQHAMHAVNKKNAALGLPAIKTSVAINTGAVIAGNIGSEKRSKFGVVGQPVNITARIEDISGADDVLISQNTLEALQQSISVGPALALRAQGIEEIINVYAVDYANSLPNEKPPAAPHE